MSEIDEIAAPPETSNMPPMPPQIAEAVIAVMQKVPKLERTEKNTHGNYNFASIDDFLEAIRPLCAENGLIILQDETDYSIQDGVNAKGQKTAWLLMTFRFMLSHKSGESWAYQPTRSIMVNATMGAQAFGAGQSYTLKHFMRSLSQIATGEKSVDTDYQDHGTLPAKKPAMVGALNKSHFEAAMRAFESERVALIMAVKNGEMSKEDGRERYAEIRGNKISYKVGNQSKSVDVGILLQQCKDEAPQWWEDGDDFKGFKARLLETKEFFSEEDEGKEPEFPGIEPEDGGPDQ